MWRVPVAGLLLSLALLSACADGYAPPEAAETDEVAVAPDAPSELQAGKAIRDAAATRALPLASRVPHTPSATPAPGSLPVAEPTPRMKGEGAPTPDGEMDAAPVPRGELGVIDVEVEVDAEGRPSAVAGLKLVRYEAGADVPWSPGLFLLDVRTGAVHGWVRPPASLADGERDAVSQDHDAIRVSPGNRFVLWTDDSGASVLYDRRSDEAYKWDPASVRFDRWWGSGDTERLLFQITGSNAFVLVNGDLGVVSQFTLPPGERFSSATGAYILVRECIACDPGDQYHIVNLEDETNPAVHAVTMPWKMVDQAPSGDVTYQIELLDNLVTIVADTGGGSCRAVRYDLDGVLRSDDAVPCSRLWPGPSAGFGLDRIPPDEGLLDAATTGLLDETGFGEMPITRMTAFDAITGREIVRVITVARRASEPDVLKLADSSALVLGSDAGLRFAAVNGAWRRTAAGPSPVDPELAPAPAPLVVTSLRGDLIATLTFAPPNEAIPDHPGSEVFLDLFADWGAAGDVLRVRTLLDYEQFAQPAE